MILSDIDHLSKRVSSRAFVVLAIALFVFIGQLWAADEADNELVEMVVNLLDDKDKDAQYNYELTLRRLEALRGSPPKPQKSDASDQNKKGSGKDQQSADQQKSDSSGQSSEKSENNDSSAQASGKQSEKSGETSKSSDSESSQSQNEGEGSDRVQPKGASGKPSGAQQNGSGEGEKESQLGATDDNQTQSSAGQDGEKGFESADAAAGSSGKTGKPGRSHGSILGSSRSAQGDGMTRSEALRVLDALRNQEARSPNWMQGPSKDAEPEKDW